MPKYDDKRIIRCTFCNRTRDQVKRLVAGPPGIFICDECIEDCLEALEEAPEMENSAAVNEIYLPKPAEIKATLDQSSEYCSFESLHRRCSFYRLCAYSDCIPPQRGPLWRLPGR